jgi:hypothetical protein
MRRTKISLITSAILVVSSFMPVLQIVLLQCNSFIAQPIGMLFGKNDNISIFWVNGIASLCMLLLFYIAKTTGAKVFSILGFLLFFLPLFYYSTGDFFTDETGSLRLEKFYFLQFLIAGIVAGIVLALIELIKSKAAH